MLLFEEKNDTHTPEKSVILPTVLLQLYKVALLELKIVNNQRSTNLLCDNPTLSLVYLLNAY